MANKHQVIVNGTPTQGSWVYGWYKTKAEADAVAETNNQLYGEKWGYTYTTKENHNEAD